MEKSEITISTFGEHLRRMRENANLSLKSVATSLGIDISLLGKIERNERHPTKEQLKALSKYFKIQEKEFAKEIISDLIAYKIIDEGVDIDTLKVAEKKIEYLKKNQEKK